MQEDTKADIEKEYGENLEAMFIILCACLGKHYRATGDLLHGVISRAGHKMITKGFIGVIKECYATYLGLKPSKRYEEVHDMLGKGVERYLSSATSLQQYIDTDDPVKMTGYLKRGEAKANLGDKYINKLIE